MAKKLTDLSQLTKAILKESPPPCPVEKPAPEPPQSREDADAAAVLAYFSRPSQNAPQRNRAVSCAVPAKDRPVAPEAALEASVRQRPGHDVEDPVRLPGESQQRQRDREQVLLTKVKVGDDCSFALHIESAEDLRRKAAAPQPKKKAVFQPKSVKDDFLAKLRLHRKRYGW